MPNPLPTTSGSIWRIEMMPLNHAPFTHGPDPLVFRVRAMDRMDALGRAGRLLKRTYGDATHKGNPMWWRSEAIEEM